MSEIMIFKQSKQQSEHNKNNDIFSKILCDSKICVYTNMWVERHIAIYLQYRSLSIRYVFMMSVFQEICD